MLAEKGAVAGQLIHLHGFLVVPVATPDQQRVLLFSRMFARSIIHRFKQVSFLAIAAG
jgi:hypothetical protein